VVERLLAAPCWTRSRSVRLLFVPWPDDTLTCYDTAIRKIPPCTHELVVQVDDALQPRRLVRLPVCLSSSLERSKVASFLAIFFPFLSIVPFVPCGSRFSRTGLFSPAFFRPSLLLLLLSFTQCLPARVVPHDLTRQFPQFKLVPLSYRSQFARRAAAQIPRGQPRQKKGSSRVVEAPLVTMMVSVGPTLKLRQPLLSPVSLPP